MTSPTNFERKALALVSQVSVVSQEKRSAFLDQACGGDAELRRHVESILAQHEKEARFPEFCPLDDVLNEDESEGIRMGAQQLGDGGVPPQGASTTADTEIPERIGKFVVRRRLGTGGFGHVYQAYDPDLQQDVALKVLKPEQRSHVDRLINEARVVAAQKHPGIVAVHGFDRHCDPPVIVYEYVEGGDLRQDMAPHMRPTWQEAAQLIGDVANALHHAHQHDYVHLDIKPANILLDTEGRPRIADFGLAVTMQQLAEGIELRACTPAYASPEQSGGRSRECGPWSDVYSLGVVLYELLTGRLPPPPTARRATGNADALFVGGLDSSLPESMVAICRQALAPERSQRFPTADDMREKLLRAIGKGGSEVSDEAAGQCAEKLRGYEREHCENLLLLGGYAPLSSVYQQPDGLRRVGWREERVPGRAIQDEGPRDDRRPRASRFAERDKRTRGPQQATGESITLEELLTTCRPTEDHRSTEPPRAVIMGPPGSGKSALIQDIAWRAAGGDFPGANGRPLLPVRIALADWQQGAPRAELDEFLVRSYGGTCGAVDIALWRKWLSDGLLLLLMDDLGDVSLDEAFIRRLRRGFAVAARCPIVVTCRTTSGRKARTVCPDFDILTLPALTATQCERFIRGFLPEFQFDRDGLIQRLRVVPWLRHLAGNPLILNALCLATDNDARALPITLADTLSRAIDRLLERRCETILYPGPEPDLCTKRAVVEALALGLLAGTARGTEHTTAAWNRELYQALVANGFERNTGAWAAALRADLLRNSGLLHGNESNGYRFAHRRLQEYLAAGALARTVNNSARGWDADMPCGAGLGSVRQFVDSRAWDPAWQEVITLLSGQIGDPSPLLEMLSTSEPTPTNPYGDDVFRHRCAIALLCVQSMPLPEVFIEKIASCATSAFETWWHYTRQGTEETVTNLAAVMPALGRMNPNIDGAPLLAWLVGRLSGPDDMDRQLAARALAAIGPSACTAQMLEDLAGVLCDYDAIVRLDALSCVRGLGTSAANEAIVARLANMLNDEDEGVAEDAAWTIGQLGTVAATPAVLRCLASLLANWHEEAHRIALTALRGIRAAAATPEMTMDLERLLKGGDEQVLWATSNAICHIGPRVSTPRICKHLLAMLAHSNMGVRVAAIRALGSLRGGLDRRETAHRLCALLRDRNWDIQEAAADALAVVGGTCLTPELLKGLTPLLAHEDETVQLSAESAVKHLARVGCGRAVLERIPVLLRHRNDKRRQAGATAVTAIGRPAATPEVRECLEAMLDNKLAEAQAEAARALGRVGDPSAQPQLLERLAQLLESQCIHVRIVAAYAIGELCTNRSADDQATAWLARLLEHHDWNVRIAGESVARRLAGRPEAEELFRPMGQPLDHEDSRAVATTAHPNEQGNDDPALSWLKERFSGLLIHESPEVRAAAASAFARVRGDDAHPGAAASEVIAALLENPATASVGAQALRELGRARSTPAVLAALQQLLRSGDQPSREEAAQTLGTLAAQGADETLARVLIELLEDEDERLRSLGALAIARLHESARVFRAADGAWVVIPVQQLTQP